MGRTFAIKGFPFFSEFKWDGTPRIEEALQHLLKADDVPYTGEVMKMHMMAAITRLYHPGTKYDIMLCLIGE
jgi:predicted P-loop ATPase